MLPTCPDAHYKSNHLIDTVIIAELIGKIEVTEVILANLISTISQYVC